MVSVEHDAIFVASADNVAQGFAEIVANVDGDYMFKIDNRYTIGIEALTQMRANEIRLSNSGVRAVDRMPPMIQDNCMFLHKD